jgi:hypothetical protein
LFETTPQGWTPVTQSVSSVAYNGNRSYTLTMSADVSATLSPGMRVRTTRTVAAPTQCTSLNGTTQYYSKTTPTGLSFTTTFTCSAWVKLSSYQAGGIIARRNADTEGWSMFIDSSGRVQLVALRIASNNKFIVSNQSLPLNKWVHVAATMDVSAGDTTTAQKIWIDGVEVPRTYNINGTITALVQGTTALVVGATKSAGTDLFAGKIAQAAVFSSQLSDATIKSYYSQGLSGTETNLVSAYSFNNSINDLNTTNANNLTAQGSAVATNADSPFSTNSFDVETGTEDYGIVQSVATTTVVVQVPIGCTIPTSGGVSAMSYSTQEAPYGFPGLTKFCIDAIADTTTIQSLADFTKYIHEKPIENLRLTNTGTAGGTLFVTQIGNTREVFGRSTAVTTTGVGAKTFTFIVPTGVFASTDYRLAQANTADVTTYADQYTHMAAAPSTTTASVYTVNTGGAAASTASLSIRWLGIVY